MTYKITVETFIESEVFVEAETEDEAIEMVEEHIYVDTYVNETVGFEEDGHFSERIGVGSIYANDSFEITGIEEQ